MFLQRQLDACETSLAGLPTAFSVRYTGVLDRSALARSFRLLCQRHPVLCARIGPDRMLSAETQECPELVVVDGDEADLYELATGDWDNSHGVARLLVVRGDAGGFVALRLDHAIADGGAYFALVTELWRLYTEVVEGREKPEEPVTELPSPPSVLVWRYLGGVEPTPSAPPAAAKATSCAARHRRIRLNTVDTAALIAATRAAGLSVNALGSAAILLALRRGRGEEPLVATVKSPVALRARVSPAVGATEVTNFAGGHTTTVTVRAQDEPTGLGRRIKELMAEGIARREYYIRGLLRMDLTELSPAPDELVIGINNHGVIPEFAQPAGLNIVDFYWPGPQPRQTGTLMSADFRLTSYAGELSLTCHFPSTRYTDEQVDRMVEDLVAELSLIAGTAMAPVVTA